VACALEGALRGRGWEVDVEFGVDARPWVQKLPPVRPSLRVLCVPGTVDRAVAQQLRAAFRPDPEADLHILGVDDSPGLVHEIERLAGVRTPPRRPLHAPARLSHATLIETQARAERSWRAAAVSAVAAFAITLGGMSLVDHAARAPELSPGSFAAGISSLTTARPADLDSETPRSHGPVLAAVAPIAVDELDALPPEDDVEIVLLDESDEIEAAASPTTSRAARRRVVVIETPLARPTPEASHAEGVRPDQAANEVTDAITSPVTVAITSPATVAITSPLPTLPAGFLTVAGLSISDAAPKRHLPKGFLPVAGMTVAPRVTMVDPFDGVGSTITEVIGTVDPFASSLHAATP
jgi:hypothetical protein